jgi:hypothetical protein
MRMALRTRFMVEQQHVNLSRGHTVTSIDQTEARLNTHEEVCNLRYESICARLKRLETIGLAAAGTIITLLVGIVLELSR